jgi:TonB family protein
MKRCDACGEEIESKFSFCPVDGQLLAESKPTKSYEYRLTLISERPLAQRLLSEGQFLSGRFRRAWLVFTAEPLPFILSQLRQLKDNTKRVMRRPHFATASVTALFTILAVIAGAILLDAGRRHVTAADEPDEELVKTATLDLRDQEKTDSKTGVGAGEKGRVGLNKGRGEGSDSKPARATGGGGGGAGSLSPPSQGRPPIPSEIPAPIPTTYAKVSQSLPAAGLNIDPVLWKDLPFRDYGDPRSKSLVPSNGPGEGGGVGDGKGQGIGQGDGTGFGPGNKNNMGGRDGDRGCCGSSGGSGNTPDPNNDTERIFRGTEVTTRARVLSKPEPQYSEEARRNQITGTVILSVVFSRTGQVTNIHAVQPLCCGLTEKAIAAARQIRFVPATREGNPVSVRMQLDYNFNLY